MIGVVDVGGGMRGIYAAGIFDYFMDYDINFDLCIGVSAGSANVASYLAKQRGRNYKFYTEYAFRKEYMSLHNYIHKGNYVDLDYVYGTLSNSHGEYPINFENIEKSPSEFLVVATKAMDGETVYFNKSDIKFDHYDIFKASSDLPFVCEAYNIDGVEYFDGGLSDPIPVLKAFDMGCDKVVVILTKPLDTIRNSRRDNVVAHLIKNDYPKMAEVLSKRAEKYNEQVRLLKEYAESGKVLIIAPDDTCGVDTLEKKKENLDSLYLKGYKDAKNAIDFINKNKHIN